MNAVTGALLAHKGAVLVGPSYRCVSASAYPSLNHYVVRFKLSQYLVRIFPGYR
jgi:hypothetical protein